MSLPPVPQLLLCLAPGSGLELVVETFTNGQRQRQTLPEGVELQTLRLLLLQQKRAYDLALREAQEKEKLLRQALRQALHRKVYNGVACDHGEAFAARTVGQPPAIRRPPSSQSFALGVRYAHIGNLAPRPPTESPNTFGIDQIIEL